MNIFESVTKIQQKKTHYFELKKMRSFQDSRAHETRNFLYGQRGSNDGSVHAIYLCLPVSLSLWLRELIQTFVNIKFIFCLK